MPEVLFSIKSSRKIVHMPHCSFIRKISKENLGMFGSLGEAYSHGYHLCNCCPSMARKYHREKKAIDSFCEEYYLKAKLADGILSVKSMTDSWKITTAGKKNYLFLYHKNKFESNRPDKKPTIIYGYHSQAWRSDTILGYLKYIVDHEQFRKNHPTRIPTSAAPAIPPDVSFYRDHKYDEELTQSNASSYQKIKGTKKYRKEQRKKKKREKWEKINRVYELLDALSTS